MTASWPSRQLPLDLGHRPALGREDFLIAPSNNDAVNWIDLWPKWPATALILHGPAASGKSHLAAVWEHRSGAMPLDPSQLSGLTARDLPADCPGFLLDHFDPWIGDRATETALFHLYNLAREQQRTILITLRTPPNRHDFAVPDLASRLRAAPAACIQPPDDELLAAVLVKLFADRQLQVGEDALAYILPRMERSFAAARDMVKKADLMALAEKRPISVPLLRDVLLQSTD